MTSFLRLVLRLAVPTFCDLRQQALVVYKILYRVEHKLTLRLNYLRDKNFNVLPEVSEKQEYKYKTLHVLCEDSSWTTVKLLQF